MKLVIIVGSGAVGKMTVGQELMKITDLRLFHNHMMIEPVIDIFGYFHGGVTQKLREVIFEDFLKSDNEGMIFIQSGVPRRHNGPDLGSGDQPGGR